MAELWPSKTDTLQTMQTTLCRSLMYNIKVLKDAPWKIFITRAGRKIMVADKTLVLNDRQIWYILFLNFLCQHHLLQCWWFKIVPVVCGKSHYLTEEGVWARRVIAAFDLYIVQDVWFFPHLNFVLGVWWRAHAIAHLIISSILGSKEQIIILM